MHHVLVITYWDFNNALVQTYTLPYVRKILGQLPKGSNVWMVTLEHAELDPVLQRQLVSDMLAEHIHWVAFRYHPFGLNAILHWVKNICWLLALVLRRNIATIHCWATPAGAVGYVLSILTGRSLVIDSYEPHAEAMVENGTWRQNSLAFRLLFAFEKYQTRRADFLVAAHEGMRTYAMEKYGVVVKNMLVKPACVDLELFHESKSKDNKLLHSLNLANKIVCVYAGKFGGIYLGVEVFAFLKEAHLRWGDRFRVLLLTSHHDEEISAYCHSADLDPSIVITRFVAHAEIPRYIGLGDFALTPVKPVPTKRYCTPIKDGEYWAMGLPVVITDGISNDSDIIRTNGVGAVLDRLDTEAYRSALDTIDYLLAQPREALRTRIRTLATTYRSFELAERVYHKIYGR